MEGACRDHTHPEEEPRLDFIDFMFSKRVIEQILLHLAAIAILSTKDAKQMHLTVKIN